MLRYTNPDKIIESIKSRQLGANIQEVSASQPIVSRRRSKDTEETDDPVKSNEQMIMDYLEMIGLDPEPPQERPEEFEQRPSSREDFYESTGLTEDPAFSSELDRLVEKYPGVSKSEIFRIIKGESSFNPKAKNKDSGAVGLFQFIPKVAAELGFTPQDILSMEPAEQLRVYDKYLERWNYSGKNSLAIMQAAPAFANESPDTVVYKRGSKAWEQNPGWRPDDEGDITIQSINDYYGRTNA